MNTTLEQLKNARDRLRHIVDRIDGLEVMVLSLKALAKDTRQWLDTKFEQDDQMQEGIVVDDTDKCDSCD